MLRNRSIRAFLATFAVLISGLVLGQLVGNTVHARVTSPYDGLDTFARAMTQIQANYVEERTTDELIHAAIRGMADSLDEQSSFYDPDTYNRLRDATEGNTSGIGVTVQVREGGLVITSVVAGGPADLAGLMPGDLIVAVDGAELAGRTLEQAVRVIKGPRGSRVVLDLVRDDERIERDVIRDEIHTPAVRGQLVQPGVGYLHIEQFRRRTGEEFVEELAHLEMLSGGSLDAVVVDLRGNPGGLLDEAVVVVDAFVSEGTIVETRGRLSEATDETIVATARDTRSDVVVVVLVNALSASASEIVAGALQDHGRAVVVGQASYGKGSVQSYFEYEDGSAMKLTIARYYLPSGRHLERGSGIVPDHEVVLMDQVDPRAALVQALDETEMDDADRASLNALIEELASPQSTPERPTFRGDPIERAATDLQLAKALELVGVSSL